MNNFVEIIKGIESGKIILVTEKGYENWRKLNVPSDGFYLNFNKFDYKIG